MSPKILDILLLTIVCACILHLTNAYRLDSEHGHSNNQMESNELKDPYFIQRLQALLAAVGTNDNTNKDSSAREHELKTRLAIHRRPGLLRLKKSD